MNFIEGKPSILRALNEPNSVKYRGRVPAHTASAMWDNQQMLSLEVPYNPNPYRGRSCELPNGNGSIDGTRRDSI